MTTRVITVDVIDYAGWGYHCEAQLDYDGVGMQYFSAGISARYSLALGIAGLSIVVLGLSLLTMTALWQ